MKIEIYEEKTKEERTLRLTLRRDEGGVVALSAVDENGKPFDGSDLLWIDDLGVHAFSGVSPELGLPIDSAGVVEGCK